MMQNGGCTRIGEWKIRHLLANIPNAHCESVVEDSFAWVEVTGHGR